MAACGFQQTDFLFDSLAKCGGVLFLVHFDLTSPNTGKPAEDAQFALRINENERSQARIDADEVHFKAGQRIPVIPRQKMCQRWRLCK